MSVELGPNRPVSAQRAHAQNGLKARVYWATATKEKANRETVGLWRWWSRRESNPRPQAITGQFYMLSWLIWFSRCDRAAARYLHRQSRDLVLGRV